MEGDERQDYSPFEILSGRPPSLRGKSKGDPRLKGGLEMSQHPQALGKIFLSITQETLERAPILLWKWVHPFQEGDEVWNKNWKKKPLQPSWTRPHTVIVQLPLLLTLWIITPVDPSHPVKRAAAPESRETWTAESLPEKALPVAIWRQQKST